MIIYLNEAAEAWLHDLETTDEPQCKGYLHSIDGFCCLGRAFIANDIQADEIKSVRNFQYHNSSTILSKQICQLLGIKPELGAKVAIHYNIRPKHNTKSYYSYLTDLNDTGRWSFKQIAVFLRRHQRYFFIPVDEQNG